MSIESDIQQSVFKNSFQKAAVNISYTASWLHQKQAGVLKTFGMSRQQFNVLRILKGMHPQPASVKLLIERMIDKMSNASRLVDKLYSNGLVDRESCSSDRRQVNVSITQKGISILDRASKEMEDEIEGVINLTSEEAELLSHLLDKLRESKVSGL